MENMNKSFIIRNGNVIGLSEKIGTTLSQEAYDALSEEKQKDGTIYFIPDGDGEIEIVDNEISETKLWSSQKISDELETKLDKGYITGITDANNAIGENGVNIFVMSASSANMPLSRTGIIRSYTTIENKYIRVNQEYSTIDNSPQNGGTYKRYGASDDGGATFTWSNWNFVGSIDDSTTASLKTWSSSKIASEIGAKITKTQYRGSRSIDISTGGKLTLIYSSEYASQAGCYILLSNFNTEPLLIELGRTNIGQFSVTATHKSQNVDTITVTTAGDEYSWYVLQF